MVNKDTIRIGYAGDNFEHSPFMVRTGKNKIAYGMIRPNKGANPKAGSAQVYLFDPEKVKMVRSGTLKTNGSQHSNDPYYDIRSTRSFRNEMASILRKASNTSNVSVKSETSCLRKAHYPSAMVTAMSEHFNTSFTRS